MEESGGSTNEFHLHNARRTDFGTVDRFSAVVLCSSKALARMHGAAIGQHCLAVERFPLHQYGYSNALSAKYNRACVTVLG